jgi:hypothetical protein
MSVADETSRVVDRWAIDRRECTDSAPDFWSVLFKLRVVDIHRGYIVLLPCCAQESREYGTRTGANIRRIV